MWDGPARSHAGCARGRGSRSGAVHGGKGRSGAEVDPRLWSQKERTAVEWSTILKGMATGVRRGAGDLEGAAIGVARRPGSTILKAWLQVSHGVYDLGCMVSCVPRENIVGGGLRVAWARAEQ